MRQALETSDASVQALSKLKYEHELQLAQLETQTRDLRSTNATLSDELQALRIQNKALDQRVFEHEKQLTQSNVRASALEQQLRDKDSVLAKTTELLDAAHVHKHEVEESLKMYRDNHARLQQKLELSISEINKVRLVERERLVRCLCAGC